MQRGRIEALLGGPGPADVPAAALRATVDRLAAVRRATLEVSERGSGLLGGGVRWTRLRARHPGRPDIDAVLLTPDRPGPLPAVLVSAGRNARLEHVVGLEPPDHPDRNVAERLAAAGLLTLTLSSGIDDPESDMDGSRRLTALADVLGLWGGSLLAALVEDALAALALLRTLPSVDPDRIGLFGHSLGAAVALHAALLTDEPLPVCAASHLGSYPVLYGRLGTGTTGGYLPGVLRYADLPQLFAALAPAPLQLQYGTADPFLDAADAAAAGERIGKAYAAAGVAGKVEVRGSGMGHGTEGAAAVEFFTRALAAPLDPPRVAVPAARVEFDAAARTEILDRVDRSLASGALTLGPHGAALEELARPWTGRPTAAVSSGSAALEIALRIVGVEGRTVLVPANTFFATAASTIRAGAAVDLVDTEPVGLGMDPAALRAALDAHPDTAAVVPVHIAGLLSPALPELLALCAERGVAVVEDAAHAIGATLDGVPAGSFGRLAAFSLYPTKVVTSGEGGLLSAADPADLDQVLRYRDQGKTAFDSNVHGLLGSNWRMSELHAATGIAHLERLAGFLERRRELARWYDEHLAGLPGLRPHPEPAGVTGNVYKYVALLDDGVDRAALKRRLAERHGVRLAGEVYDTPLHRQPYLAARFAGRCFPVAERFADRHVCLPVFPSMTAAQRTAVLRALRTELG